MDTITVHEIIKTLGVKQRNNITDFRPREQKLYRKAPEFLKNGGEGGEGGEGDLYIDTEIGEGDLITQLLRMVNPKFQIVGNRVDIVKEFRNKLVYDLDQLKLGMKFGYNKDSGFKRKKVSENLINKERICKPESFGDVFSSVVRYLADYFDINIVVYSSDYNFENMIGVDFYYSRRGSGGRLDKKKPVVEFIYTTRFCPVVDKGGCGVRNWEDRIEKVFDEVKMDLIDYKSMSKYKLDELIELANMNKLELKKLSDKSGKAIKKTKKDLYGDLFYLVDL